MAMGSPRFYGFVIGGTLSRPRSPRTGWSRRGTRTPGSRQPTPATAAVEEVAAAWLLDLLGSARRQRRRLRHRRARARTSRALDRRRATRCCASAGTTRRADIQRAPAIRFLAGDAVHTLRRARRAASPGSARPMTVGADDAGPHRRRRPRRAPWPSTTGPAIVALQAGRRALRRVRRLRRGDRRRARCTARGCTSTARSGCGRRRARASATWSQGADRRRLVGDRRPQDAQRALRLRRRDRPRRSGDDGVARRPRGVPARRRERRRPVRPRARAVAPRPRRAGVGGAALARAAAASSTSSTGWWMPRPPSPTGFRAHPRPRGAQRRRLHPGVPRRARTTPTRPRWGSGCAPRERCGRRHRRGAAARSCASP